MVDRFKSVNRKDGSVLLVAYMKADRCQKEDAIGGEVTREILAAAARQLALSQISATPSSSTASFMRWAWRRQAQLIAHGTSVNVNIVFKKKLPHQAIFKNILKLSDNTDEGCCTITSNKGICDIFQTSVLLIGNGWRSYKKEDYGCLCSISSERWLNKRKSTGVGRRSQITIH